MMKTQKLLSSGNMQIMRSVLSHEFKLSDLIEELSKEKDTLASYHFTAKSRAALLSSCRANLTDDYAIILLKFVEKFSFIVQGVI